MLNDSYVQLSVLFALNYSFIRNKDSPEVPKDSNDPTRTIGKYYLHSFVFNQFDLMDAPLKIYVEIVHMRIPESLKIVLPQLYQHTRICFRGVVRIPKQHST